MDFVWGVILSLPLQNQIVAGFLAFMLVLFLGRFLIPGLLTYNRIRELLRNLQASKDAGVDAFAAHFANDDGLDHLWNEYRETLHKQRELNATTGELEVTALRSTVPAEMFFSHQAVIDSRLGTEFFKHLPGIFTGVGIIGTFLGLITGLQNFRVTEDATEVRSSLEVLVHQVGEAFLISNLEWLRDRARRGSPALEKAP